VAYITVSDHLKVVVGSVYFQQGVHEALRELEGVQMRQLIFIQLHQSLHSCLCLLLTLFDDPLHFLLLRRHLPILSQMLQEELLGEQFSL
jgi:hypothetical protein